MIQLCSTVELKNVVSGQQKLPRFIINIVIITMANRLNVAVNSHRTLSHCSHTQTAQRISIKYTKRLTLINFIFTASKSTSNNHTLKYYKITVKIKLIIMKRILLNKYFEKI